MSITEISPVPPIDLNPEEIEVGDQQEFVDKMNSYHTKLETWSQNIYQQAQDLSTMRDEILSLLNSFQATVNAANSTANSANTAAGNAVTTADEANALSADYSRDMALNLLPDSGRLQSGGTSMIHGQLRNNSGVFDPSGILSLFGSYNNTDFAAATEIGRFYYNSITHGGTAPAITGAALVFANKMFIPFSTNDAQKRRVPDFSIVQVIAGDGETGVEYEGDYRILHTNDVLLSAINGRISFSFWYRPMDGHAHIRPTSGERIWVDGTLLETANSINGSGFHRLTQNTIVHIAVAVEKFLTLDPFLLDLHAPAGSRHWFACPRLSPGSFQMEEHFMPVRSIGQSE